MDSQNDEARLGQDGPDESTSNVSLACMNEPYQQPHAQRPQDVHVNSELSAVAWVLANPWAIESWDLGVDMFLYPSARLFFGVLRNCWLRLGQLPSKAESLAMLRDSAFQQGFNAAIVYRALLDTELVYSLQTTAASGETLRQVQAEALLRQITSTYAEQPGAKIVEALPGMLAKMDALMHTGEADDRWDEPVPLDDLERPEWPAGLFPDWLEAFLGAAAEWLQVPFALVGMLILAALSVVMSKRITVAGASWQEPVNIYVAALANSGERKSSTFRAATAPLTRWEQERLREHPDHVARVAMERGKLERRLKELQNPNDRKARLKARGKNTDESELAIRRKLETLGPPPKPILCTEDATPEALAKLLAEHGGRMAVLSPEGGGVFGMMGGRYAIKGRPNYEVYLKGHAGDAIKVHRAAGREDIISNPAVTLAVAIQPDVLRRLDIPGAEERGLLARFFFAVPTAKVGYRGSGTIIPEDILVGYHDGFRVLLERFRSQPPEPHQIKLSEGAEEVFLEFREWNERELRAGGEMEGMEAWGSKLPGAVLRLAGLLHVATHLDNDRPWEEPISGDLLNRVAVFAGNYLLLHARAALGMVGARQAVTDSRYLLRRLREIGQPTIRKQLLWQLTKRKLDETTRLDKALEVLEGHGWVRGRRGPRGREYELNPALLPSHGDNLPSRNGKPQTEVIVADGRDGDPGDARARARDPKIAAAAARMAEQQRRAQREEARS